MAWRHRPALFPVVVLLGVGLIVFYPALRKLTPFEEWLRVTPKTRMTEPKIKVWVSQRSGLYYCPQSDFYGKAQPGFYMA
jgi:hypothetical protein